MTVPFANHRAVAALILALTASVPAGPIRAEAEQAKVPVRAYNQSGQDLFRAFAREPGNIVFSPYSVGAAMAMVLSGARGETQAEMIKVLRHQLPAAGIDAANAQALAVLAAHNQPASAAKLRIANALMLVNAAATVAPSFEEAMRTGYGAEIFRGGGLDTVNGWVKEKTEGKIDKILERLNSTDSHVLLNAVYFNAPWAQAFSKNGTRDREFHLTATEAVEVPTMAQQGEFGIVKGDGFSAIRLPYAADGLSMVILRPDDVDGIETLVAGLDGEKIEALLQSLTRAPKRMVALSMPRFKLEFKAELIEPFKSLGLRMVFDPAQSDLSGMTGLPRTEAQSAIDQIVHRAVIEVAEEGTEAAAATAVVVTTRSMRPEEIERFEIDRPFVFMIADDKTGAVLFEGRISDPRG